MEEKNDLQQKQNEDKNTDLDENDLNNPFIYPNGFLPLLKWLVDLPLNTLYY